MTRTRDEIELDLPFYVNGTLDAQAMAEMDALLAEDALLQAELDDLRAIRADMQAEEVRSPGEFGLARLMRDAGATEAGTQAQHPAEVQQLHSAPAPNRTWMWQIAAVAAFVALIGQNVLGLAPFGGTQNTPANEGGFVMAGAETAPSLVVSFAPDATESQIRGLLLDLGLEITSGPSALGLYRLAQAESEELDAEAQALMAATGIVESVENVSH